MSLSNKVKPKLEIIAIDEVISELLLMTIVIYIKKRLKIPIIFHNLENYDSLMQELGKYGASKRLGCIGKDIDKYIGLNFSIDDLKFLDSYYFLSSSLDTLASTLSGFRFVEHPLTPIPLVDKLSLTTLPPKEAFFSKLTKEY